MTRKIGLIGAGFMGYGIAMNLIKNKFKLKVIAHKKRKNINNLVKNGAMEVQSYSQLCKDIDCLIICVTNTPIAIKIANITKSKLKTNALVIDITTHNMSGSIKMNNIFLRKKIRYIESPVMGGPVQALNGELGAILGGKKADIKSSQKYLRAFCKDYIHFGSIGKGAHTKLINNFLALGTTTLVIETIKATKFMGIDLKKFYKIAKLGSGNSGALNRIADKAIKKNYKGYVFTVNNTLKDLTYINELFKKDCNANKISKLFKNYYKNSIKKGYGNLLISELVNKKDF